MRTKQYYNEDDDDDDSPAIIRDRGSLKVPMTLMDHKLYDALARRYPPTLTCGVTDAFGNPAGHRPGYLFSTNDAAAKDADAAWEERGRILQNAWRGLTPNASMRSTTQKDLASQDRSRPADVKAAWEERGRLMREAWRSA